MKSFVCVKRVPDTAANIRVNQQGRVETDGLEFVTSPYDEYALEEAVRIKEQQEDGEVVVISLGGADVKKTIQDALARGGDRGIHLFDDDPRDPHATACALSDVIEDEDPDLIWFGKHAVDDDGYQVGSIVAARLNLPVATFVVDVQVEDDQVRVERESDDGVETLTLDQPCVLTAEKGLNEPRYASLQEIMQAKQKEIDRLEASPVESTVEVLKHEEPPERPPGEIVGEGPEAVPELVRKLREEAGVI